MKVNKQRLGVIPLKALHTCSTAWKLNERMHVILLSIDMSHFYHISVVYLSYAFFHFIFSLGIGNYKA
jgi:hypothetical protein